MSESKNKLLRYIKRAGAGSMLISIIVHVIVIIGATVWVVSSVQPQRKALFKGGDNGGSPVQHPVKMSNTQPKLDTLNKRLSVDSPSATVALPDLPSNQDSGVGSPTLNTNAGNPGASGGLKGPLMPLFGFKEAQPGGTLIGTFYDFKQLRSLKPNPDFKGNVDAKLDQGASVLAYEQVIKFVKSGWGTGNLAKYYKAPTPLYATQIFIPMMQASEAPKAYGVEKEVKSKAWMAFYRGKVSPPKDGAYRLVGAADDILIVQIDGRLVLDGSLSIKTGFETDQSGLKSYPTAVGSIKKLVIGKRMELKAGQFYDIKIAISEAPGGIFGAYLFFEQEGVTYAKNAQGTPVLPIFRVAPSQNEAVTNAPKFMADGPIWRALPAPKD